MKDFAIVVCSSDQRLEFIPIFQHFLNANLSPEEREKVYLAGCTNTRAISFSGIHVLPFDGTADSPWSRRILDSIASINEENILLLTEDILFLPNKGGVTIALLYENFVRDQLKVLRIDSFPSPEAGPCSLYGPVSKFSIHRVSLQPSFWHKPYLQTLLRQDESIWEFELRGSRRSRQDDGVFALRHNVVPYREVIAKGCLSVAGSQLLKQAKKPKPADLRQRGLVAEFAILARLKALMMTAQLLKNQKKFTGL